MFESIRWGQRRRPFMTMPMYKSFKKQMGRSVRDWDHSMVFPVFNWTIRAEFLDGLKYANRDHENWLCRVVRGTSKELTSKQPPPPPPPTLPPTDGGSKLKRDSMKLWALYNLPTCKQELITNQKKKSFEECVFNRYSLLPNSQSGLRRSSSEWNQW